LICDRIPKIEFLIYGDGPEKLKLEKLIKDLGLNGKVFIKKGIPLNEIAKIMAEADIGIVPKRNDNFGSEAFSTKILEFMALGTPVLVAKTKIDFYYFYDSIVKFFEPENERDLASCILELINDDKEREKLSKNALEFVKNYTWDRNKQGYFEIIDRLISKSLCKN